MYKPHLRVGAIGSIKPYLSATHYVQDLTSSQEESQTSFDLGGLHTHLEEDPFGVDKKETFKKNDEFTFGHEMDSQI